MYSIAFRFIVQGIEKSRAAELVRPFKNIDEHIYTWSDTE